MSCKVIVTRPIGQNQYLIDQLNQLGCETVAMPTLDIVSEPETASIKQKFLDIDQYYAVIAISANAAHFGIEYLDRFWPQLPIKINWLAVGPATIDVMRDFGMAAQMPEQQFDSEGLLQLDCLQQDHIYGEKILIWRGVGGRETLAETLRQRGADVHYAEIYQRIVPQHSQLEWQQASRDADLLLVSSGQGLQAVMQQCPDLNKQVRAILAPSERVAKMAKEYGFEHVVNSASARDQDTIKSVQQFLANRA